MDEDSTPGKKPAPSVSRPQGTLLLRKTREQARIEGLRSDMWSDDDYTVVDPDIGRRVGRIYPETIHGEPRWLWFLQTVPAPKPNSGIVGSLEEAMEAIKRRYQEVKGRT